MQKGIVEDCIELSYAIERGTKSADIRYSRRGKKIDSVTLVDAVESVTFIAYHHQSACTVRNFFERVAIRRCSKNYQL